MMELIKVDCYKDHLLHKLSWCQNILLANLLQLSHQASQVFKVCINDQKP